MKTCKINHLRGIIATEVIYLNYGIYKSTRNSSWRCLIDCNITELPIKPVKIAAFYGLTCLLATTAQLNGMSGMVEPVDNNIYISFNGDEPVTRQRFTIMHELGHYVLGHLGDTPLSRSERECKPEEETAADRFAADMLMPACVLWGLGIHTAEDIARVCGVSIQAARIRAERMEVLYRRNMFLSHPLERQVFQQFKPWIDKCKYHGIF